MPVQIGAGPQADFTQPLGLLMDCHRRIERFLGILLRVVDDTAGQALDDEHRRALDAALTYFRTAAPRHTQDEEHSLFPRMRRSQDPAVQRAMAAMDELERDHRAAEVGHARVDELGLRWLADGTLPPTQTRELREVLVRLREDYQRHIRFEDQELFPLASKLLDETDLKQVGDEMRQRRRSS